MNFPVDFLWNWGWAKRQGLRLLAKMVWMWGKDMQSYCFWSQVNQMREKSLSIYLTQKISLVSHLWSTVLLSKTPCFLKDIWCCESIRCNPDYQPRYFQNVVLVSCFSDSYGPFDSARVMNSAFPTICPTEIPTEITGKKPRWRLGTCWECTRHRRLTRKLCRICGKMSLR